MARTMWGVVYGTANPHIRQHIYPDDDSELDTYPVGPGEKLIRVPIDPAHTPETFQRAIEAAVCQDAGVDALMPIEFVIVDPDGFVVSHLVGDKDLYSAPEPGHRHISIRRGDKVYDTATNKFIE